MKISILMLMMVLTIEGFTQNLQLHYDFRHSADPELNEKNFPSVSFEYFKAIDTLGLGSFLLKFDSYLNGSKNNVGQVFTQVSQTFRFWKPKVYLSLNYSGGLGVTPTSYGYYISNSFGAGLAYPFQWKGAWLSTSLCIRMNVFEKPSYDPQVIVYFGKGFLNYRIFTAGSFVCWTENRNQGNDFTADLTGKKFAFFGDPQVWFKLTDIVSLGSKINVYYLVLSNDNQLQLYPTVGLKFQL